MSILTTTPQVNETGGEPVGVRVTSAMLSVDLIDGRSISVPTAWFPRLAHGTPAEWVRFELGHFGVHWPHLDEDISVEGLLRGERSGESARSFERWLAYRAKGERVPVLELPLPDDMADESEKTTR